MHRHEVLLDRHLAVRGDARGVLSSGAERLLWGIHQEDAMDHRVTVWCNRLECVGVVTGRIRNSWEVTVSLGAGRITTDEDLVIGDPGTRVRVVRAAFEGQQLCAQNG